MLCDRGCSDRAEIWCGRVYSSIADTQHLSKRFDIKSTSKLRDANNKQATNIDLFVGRFLEQKTRLAHETRRIAGRRGIITCRRASLIARQVVQHESGKKEPTCRSLFATTWYCANCKAIASSYVLVSRTGKICRLLVFTVSRSIRSSTR